MNCQKIVAVMSTLVFLIFVGTVSGTEDDTRLFTDDLGRTVSIPNTIDKVIPSGVLALTVLISFDPDYFAATGSSLPASAETYLPKLYAKNLTRTGSLLASSDTVNYEEVMKQNKMGADVYIDVGQIKADVADSLNAFSETVGMPAVFISQHALDEIPDSYRKIGELLGDSRRGNELYAYTKGWIDRFTEGMKQVESSGKKKSAILITDIDGNSITLMGGFGEDKNIGYAGTALNTLADNLVPAKTTKGTGDTYGMEEVLTILGKNQPDVIFVIGSKDHTVYWSLMNNPSLSSLSAVREGRVYEIPADCPFIWTAHPFSGWGICGMIWIANLLYPDIFTYNAQEKIQEFYQTMIGYTMTDEEYANLTAKPSHPTVSPVPLSGILAGLFALSIILVRRTK